MTLHFTQAPVAVPFTAEGGSIAHTLPVWFSGIERTGTPPAWPYYWDGSTGNGGGPDPENLRIRRRVFVGQAADYDDLRGGTNFPNWGTNCASWIGRDSDLIVMARKGTLAISGMARTADKGALEASTSALTGYVLNDAANGFGRALYAEVQHESGALGSVGVEVVGKNKGVDKTSTPYDPQAGVDGAWLVAGGDGAYGGTPSQPCDTALWVRGGDAGTANYRWNKGIVFSALGLSGTEGLNSDAGVGVAIEMAKQHSIQWRRPNASVGAFIYSKVEDGQIGGAMKFENAGVFFYSAVNQAPAGGFRPVSSSVNYAEMYGAVTGDPVKIQAAGADTNIPILLLPKGSAGIRYKADLFVNASTSTIGTGSSGRLVTNEGATGRVDYTLPSAAAGLIYSFYVQDADGVRVNPGTGDTIRIAATQSGIGANGYIESTSIGSAVTLVAININEWIAISVTGTWTVDT